MAKKKGPAASGTDGGGAPSPTARKISTQTVTDYNSNNVKIGGSGGKVAGSNSPGNSGNGIKGAKSSGQSFVGAPPLTDGRGGSYTAGHRPGTRGKR